MAKEGLNAMRRNCLASFQKLRRLQCAVDGYCRCISCGKVGHWKTMDALIAQMLLVGVQTKKFNEIMTGLEGLWQKKD